MSDSTYVYVSYIATKPEKLWEALTSGEFTQKYLFGQAVQSDWQEGSDVTFLMENGEAAVYGKVLKCDPPHVLSFTWEVVGDDTPRERPTQVTFELKPMDGAVKLTLKHEELLPSDLSDEEETFVGANNGWPAILSKLKSLLETANPLPGIEA